MRALDTYGPAWLFVPGDRPDRWPKAAAADVVIIDLEDSVAAEAKVGARDALGSCSLDPARVMVRVNPARSSEHSGDVEAVVRLGFAGIVVPKVEDPADLAAVGADTTISVIALCETAAGVLSSREIARDPRVSALMFGSEDLAASIGGPFSRDGHHRLLPHIEQARIAVALAAAAATKAWVDTPFVRLGRPIELSAESRTAMTMGATAKAAIHPEQIRSIRRGFRPTDDEVAWAREVVDHDGSVGQVAGGMIDAPVRRQADRILQLATIPLSH